MSFNDLQQSLYSARNGREESERTLFRTREQLNKVRRQKAERLRYVSPEDAPNDPILGALSDKEASLNSTIQTHAATVDHKRLIEIEEFESFLNFTDPREHLNKLDDQFPILLFPLRIETRFKTVDDGSGGSKHQLWVRAYPDEVAIDSFEDTLSEEEVDNAKFYWSNLWRAGGIEEQNRAAWRLLLSRHGSGRAYWIIKHELFQPLNRDDMPDKANKDDIILVIATESLPEEPERDTVANYWHALWLAGSDKEQQTVAWVELVAQLGEARAQEVVEQYRPFNFADTPAEGLARDAVNLQVSFIHFPDSETLETRFQSWSTTPRVNILPEKLVLLAFNEDRENPVLNELGNPIPANLATGPDPMATGEEQIHIDEGELVVSEPMKWMVDFDEAVVRGMGFKIDLSDEQAAQGFDRLFVLGVRLSEDHDAARTSVETLFTHHHQSRKGFEIIPQGRVTNNTEEEESAYSWREDPDVSYDLYFKESETEDTDSWLDKHDGRWLAEYLGIDADILKPVANYFGTDQSEARAMNIALWPATLGYFMESMIEPVFGEQVIAQTRSHFQHFVLGRGIIPAIRIGKQPYGILPATPFKRMQWLQGDDHYTHLASAPGYGHYHSYLLALYQVLQKIDADWETLLDKVSYIGKPGGDAHQMLLDIVGLNPNSVEFYNRYAQSREQIYNTLNLKLSGMDRKTLFRYLDQETLTDLLIGNYEQSGMELLAAFGYHGKGHEAIPEILKKYFFGRNDLLKGGLIDDQPLSEVDNIRAYTEEGYNYIRWLLDAASSSHDTLRKQQGFTNNHVPTALLYLLLHHALDLGYLEASRRLHRSAELYDDEKIRQSYKDPAFIHIQEPELDIGSRWQDLYKTQPAITGDPEKRVEAYIPTALHRTENATLRQQLQALTRLEQVPTARLERALVEHLDNCAYRLDAWHYSLVNHQLALMRNNHPDNEESTPRQGVYIGAYGWLNNVRSEEKTLTPAEIDSDLKPTFDDPDQPLMEDDTNEGYIHALSENHAVTAAILRNGYMVNATPDNPETLAVNLSSERVRLALSMIEGIRNGQSLAALLGYQLERGMHDRYDVEIDEFIYDLRKAFPLNANHLESTHEADPESIDRIEARNVVDGLALIEQIERSGVKHYPFGRNDLPTSITTDQRNAINEEVGRLRNISDAVADLSIAEGVHQVVMGNSEAAAASLDAYSKASFPPIPEVIQTPRSGTSLTHRIGIHLPANIPPGTDTSVSVRAMAEPALNAWLNNLLPALNTIACRIVFHEQPSGNLIENVVDMEQLSLQAIDLLYMVEMENEQAMNALDEMIVRYVMTSLPVQPESNIEIRYTETLPDHLSLFELSPLIDTLRSLIQRSRPLISSDVMLPNEASAEQDVDIRLNPDRITLVKEKAVALKGDLDSYISTIEPLVTSENIAGLKSSIDNHIISLSTIYQEVSFFGHLQSSFGFLLEWRRQQFELYFEKVGKLINRWQDKLDVFDNLIADYDGLPASVTDTERLILLQKAELTLSTRATIPIPADFVQYRDDLINIKKQAFNNRLAEWQSAMESTTLGDLYAAIDNASTDVTNFELTALEDMPEISQLLSFARDILEGAKSLRQTIEQRLQQVDEHWTTYTEATTPGQRVDALLEAAKPLLGEGFRIIPEFALTETQALEYQQVYEQRAQLLRYQKETHHNAFPEDEWLYGVARVREKMHHLENMTLLAEALNNVSITLDPLQFPYREEDSWLALEYPKTRSDDTPFTIDEDKLLYTAYFTSATFDPSDYQCGLLVDEWTEVIPSEQETTGLTFQYDRPNAEPPQTLLLVTPSEFQGSWQWQDLIDTLHETLDMAKKRAIEPDHIDTTDYARFLPGLVSASTVYPVTAALNLAFNNAVYTTLEI